MTFASLISLAASFCLSALILGCGLDGVRGEIVHIEDSIYVVKDIRGTEICMRVDEQTNMDVVKVGDKVQAFQTKDGYAQFIQRLD